MIYITGDTHNTVDCGKIFHFAPSLSKDDYIIIAGDFGGIWYNTGSEKYKYDVALLDKYADLDCTILFVDGNHENFPEIYAYPTVEKFDGVVGQIRENLFHLKRGYVYTIENKKIFTFGGALSVDKHMRTPFISWWEEEIPTMEEMNFGMKTLDEHNWKVDYVITHTAPNKIVNKILAKDKWNMWNGKRYDPTTNYLQEIVEKLKFKKWYFGHFHEDEEITPKFHTLYNDIVKIGD